MLSSVASVGRNARNLGPEKIGALQFLKDSPCVSDGRAPLFVYDKVPKQWMDCFMNESRHPVFELESLPIVIALYVWENFPRNGQSMFYIDNEAAREVLIDSATPSESGG